MNPSTKNKMLFFAALVLLPTLATATDCIGPMIESAMLSPMVLLEDGVEAERTELEALEWSVNSATGDRIQLRIATEDEAIILSLEAN